MSLDTEITAGLPLALEMLISPAMDRLLIVTVPLMPTGLVTRTGSCIDEVLPVRYRPPLRALSVMVKGLYFSLPFFFTSYLMSGNGQGVLTLPLTRVDGIWASRSVPLITFSRMVARSLIVLRLPSSMAFWYRRATAPLGTAMAAGLLGWNL